VSMKKRKAEEDAKASVSRTVCSVWCSLLSLPPSMQPLTCTRCVSACRDHRVPLSRQEPEVDRLFQRNLIHARRAEDCLMLPPCAYVYTCPRLLPCSRPGLGGGEQPIELLVKQSGNEENCKKNKSTRRLRALGVAGASPEDQSLSLRFIVCVYALAFSL